MTVRVRAFAERDYAAYTRIFRMTEGEPVEVATLRARDSRWDRSRYEKVRVVAVDEEDAPLGFGEIHHEPSRFEPRRYFVRLGVDPRLRRRGIGAALWTQLAAELEERRAAVACLWARDHTACVDFIARRGFREVTRSYAQVLAVATAPQPTPATRERLAAAGVRIVSLAELATRDENALVKAHALHSEAHLDQHSLGPVTALTFADWKAYHVDDPEALPDAYLLAVRGDALVGHCAARRDPRAEDVLDMGLVAVRPEVRRRGIGRGLMLALHEYARAHGYQEIHTSTARDDAAIVALNTSLGYAIVESSGGYELAIPSSP